MRILILALCLVLPAEAQQIHCGTARLFRSSGAKGIALHAKRGASGVAYRTYETPHFLISYTLSGLNRVKTVEADSLLLRLADSLASTAPGHGTGAGDNAFIAAGLDKIGAPHPRYVATLSAFLEQARGYYVDTLGMRAPRSEGTSFYYQVSPGNEGKYLVDIVDIGTAVREYRGDPYYALTFPSASGGMLVENDFLYNARLDSADPVPKGTAITSMYQGALIHRYDIDWEDGLKVTAFHEFYHSVQFTYTPDPSDQHVWYETGAVGMEERNAPEVNDYLQYLPAFFHDLPGVGMFNYPDRLSWYGNGIFHLFLQQELGADFDAALWSRLAENGNDIRDALARMGASRGKSLRQLYAEFATQLALFSGRPALPPFLPFSPDMPTWPAMQSQALDVQPLDPYQGPIQPPFTITAWKIRGAAGSGKSLLVQDTGMVPVLAFYGPDSSVGGPVQGSVLKLDFGDEPGRENLLLLANGSTTQALSTQILILKSVESASLFAYPNPLRDGPANRLYFSRLPRNSDIRIISEAGLTVRSLSFAPDSTFWSWDLKDGNGAMAKPGIYYYRENGGPLAPVLLY